MKTYANSGNWAAVIATALWLTSVQPCAGDIAPTVLPIPTGYTTGGAVAVNASGQVAGAVSVDKYAYQACVWTDGTPMVLGTPLGYSSQARAINNSGVVVGYCTDESTSRALRWVPGSTEPQDLGALTDETWNEAVAINDQGQILCKSGDRWFLWEEVAGITEIKMADGSRINAEGLGPWGGPGLLSSDGRVAGMASVYKVVDGQAVYYRAAVLWRKSASGVSVTELSASTNGADGGATAISDNGIIACYSSVDGYFLYDSNTGSKILVDTVPTGSTGVTYSPVGIIGVNNSGQAVFMMAVFDDPAAMDPIALELWRWENDTWMQLPVQSLAPTDPVDMAFGYINDNGQVAGFASTYSGFLAFAWSADTGIERLLWPEGKTAAWVFALNDSGRVVGGAWSDFHYGTDVVPMVWQLAEPPTALVIQDPAVVTRNGKTFTATLALFNSSANTAYDVTVTSASLDGVASNSPLPLVFGAIKAGASKKCTLQFKNVPKGIQTLTLSGTSSLGGFSLSCEVTVP